MSVVVNQPLRHAVITSLIQKFQDHPQALVAALQGANDAFCDFRCTPNQWAPGYWQIEAVTDAASLWWADSCRPEVGHHLGACSFVGSEVTELLQEANADGLLVSVDGFLPEVQSK